MLERNISISDLNLESNNIKDEGIILLNEGLASNYSLKLLNLFNNKISEKGLLSLSFFLQNNKIFEKKLFICHNEFKPPESKAFKSFKNNNTVTFLDI